MNLAQNFLGTVAKNPDRTSQGKACGPAIEQLLLKFRHCPSLGTSVLCVRE